MGRLSAVITVASLLLYAAPTRAAELTHVATAAEPDSAFNFDLSVRWERSQKRATITRERATAASASEPFGRVDDVPELSYSEITNQIVPRIGFGVYQDVELHFELPYYLGQDVSWKYASGVALAADSSVTTNGIDANGAACASPPCPLFYAGAKETTVYHGGVLGDLKAGVAWGILSDVKDDTKPYWLIGLDVTFPTSALYDPWEGRTRTGSTFDSPYSLPTKVAGVGQKIWKFDLQTALSKRIGPIDPYFKAHLTLPHRFSSTYSNCDHVGDPSPRTPPQTTPAAATNCDLPQWKDTAGAQLPWNTGLTFGIEFVTLENKREGQRVVIDTRLIAEYTSQARWYNELTDATGKLLQTGSHMELGGLISFLFRASRYVAVQGQASYTYETAHLLTGEPLGVTDTTNSSPNQNPNFDWRWDAPGRRFRISSASVFALQVNGIVNF
jgi:hypothetical protein